mgnify:CR=1 FL=1
MLEDLRAIWEFTLATAPSGQSITVGQVLLVVALVVVGYFGSLTNHNNKSILKAILAKHPDWTLLLIGRVIGDYSDLARFPNLVLAAHMYRNMQLIGDLLDRVIRNSNGPETLAAVRANVSELCDRFPVYGKNKGGDAWR